ncbi:MAG: AMP-binding protein, partial [Planctomycetota bacterium]
TGAEMAYSDPRRLRDHLAAVQPTWMASVPRVWEMVLHLSGYTRHAESDPEKAKARLQRALGGRLRCAVSGGGRLPDAADQAYADAGIRLLVGYGLTEASPVLTVRDPRDNRLGTIGRAVDETEISIVDRVTGEALPTNTPGVILARGPQVMRGYWEDPERSAAVLREGGWFDTGDLGELTEEGDLVFRGRAKETIVLRGGEKIEPAPLEEQLSLSPVVAQVIVIGSDEKVLAALVVPQPEAVEAAVKAAVEAGGDPPGVEDLVRAECSRLLTEDAGFMVHERISRVAVLEEPFTVENGLMTATLKIKRGAVLERHADRVRALFER